MSLRRWLTGLAVVVWLGLLKVAERNTLLLQGSLLGERMSRLHETESEIGWARARVTALRSPMHLSMIAQERHPKLVAWSTVSDASVSLRARGATTARIVDGRAGKTGGVGALKLSKEDRP